MQNAPIASTITLRIPQWKAVRLFSFLSLFFLFTFALRAQLPYPTFTTGGQTVNTVAEGYGPSLTVFNGVLYEAYVNSASEHLDVATSTNGITFSQPTFTGVALPSIDFSPSITTFNNLLYIAYMDPDLAGYIAVITSPNGTTWSDPVVLALPYPQSLQTSALRGKPTIYAYGNYIYLAYVASTSTGPQVYIGFCESGNWPNFSSFLPAGAYSPVSDPTITSFDGDLAVVYLTDSNGNPVVSLFEPPNSSGGFKNISNAETTGIELVNDPGAVEFSGYLFIFGQSIFQAEDNLWAIETPDGTTFEPQHEYGQVVSGGPGINLYNGDLIEVARSKYDSNMWAYLAP